MRGRSVCAPGFVFALLLVAASAQNWGASTDDANVNVKEKHACQKSNRTWAASSWTNCSRECGGGFSTRTITCTCVAHPMMLIFDRVECANIPKPSVNESCNPEKCPIWIKHKWGECSKTCGDGVASRGVVCHSETKGSLLDSDCVRIVGPKPPTEKKCKVKDCPKYRWVSDKWTDCSKPCGGGHRTRNVKCSSDAGIVADSACTVDDAGDKPAAKEKCNVDKCPFTGRWEVGSYSACSKVCNTGVSTRSVTCVSIKNGAPAKVSECDPKDRPSASSPCNPKNCEFKKDVWSECLATQAASASNTSGKCAGEKSRKVTCVNPNEADKIVEDKWCREVAQGGKAPASVQKCQVPCKA